MAIPQRIVPTSNRPKPSAGLQPTGAKLAFELAFELACLAASTTTGCENYKRPHEKSIRDAGGSKEMVQDAVRIAAAGIATPGSSGPHGASQSLSI